MYYVSGGKAYVKTDKGFAEATVNAKYKVIKTEEIESMSVEVSSKTVESLENARECTLSEIIAQIGVVDVDSKTAVPSETATPSKKSKSK